MRISRKKVWQKLHGGIHFWQRKNLQRLLEHMADEAWAEIQAGLATPIEFSNNGEIGPG